MAPKFISVWSVLAFACNVYSLAFQGPKETPTPVVDESGISPKPTQASRLGNELRRRDIAFDWDCGWYGGTSMSAQDLTQIAY
jgi:hypothetical protein